MMRNHAKRGSKWEPKSVRNHENTRKTWSASWWDGRRIFSKAGCFFAATGSCAFASFSFSIVLLALKCVQKIKAKSIKNRSQMSLKSCKNRFQIYLKSADPRSGVLEHPYGGSFTSPPPPSALGVAKIRPPSPRRGWLKKAFPSEGLVKEKKILRRRAQ